MLKDYMLRSYVRKKLNLGRYLHSLRTAETAGEIAVRFGESADEARVAGLTHDLARDLSPEALMGLAVEDRFELLREDQEYPILLHGRAAAVLLERDLGEHRESILQAVRWHTVGEINMGTIGMVLFIADYIEPGRSHFREGFREEVLGESGIFDMFMMVLTHQLEHHKKIRRRISERTKRLIKVMQEDRYAVVQTG